MQISVRQIANCINSDKSMEVSQVRRNRRQGNKTNGTIRWRLIITVFALTLALGLMGTAAAQWSDSIFIDAKSITTGSMQVWFPLEIEKQISNAFIEADVDKYSNEPPQHELYLTVKKIPNNRFVEINFKIENIGSVPAKVGAPYMVRVDKDPNTDVDAFSLTDWNPPDRIDPGKTNTAHFTLNINATTPGYYSFEAIIPAWPWNQLGAGAWTDNLYVKGHVTIPPPSKTSGSIASDAGEQLAVEQLAGEQLAGEQLE